MGKQLSEAQEARQKTRSRRGRYTRMLHCEDCGRTVEVNDYYSLEDCNETGVGVTLCKKCHDKRRKKLSKKQMKYELEKVRRYFYLGKDDTYTVLKESDSLEELKALAKKTKLRVGKTFHETLVINEWTDDHADIYQVLFQKDSEDDWDDKTDKRKVRKKQ